MFNKWIILVVAFLVSMFVVAPMIGITSVWNAAGFAIPVSILFSAAVVFTLQLAGLKVLPIRLAKNMLVVLVVAMWGLTAFTSGWLSNIWPQGSVTPPQGDNEGVSVVTCKASVSDNIRGLDASVILNAWDLESNTPKASPVDITTCYIYQNGNGGDNYLNSSVDSSAGEVTGFNVGDTASVYCGGTTYYADPVQDICVDGQSKKVNIDAHAILSETDLQTVAYDDSGSTTLSSGVNGTDYYMTQGADAEQAIYLKLKNNVANKAYQFAGWGTFTFYNISSVVPQGDVGAYTNVAAPEHMKALSVAMNDTSGADSFTGDYSVYTLSSPKMLHEWDSIKEQFIVKTGTNDPVGGTLQDHISTTGGSGTFNGFAILAKDATYSKATDGSMAFGIASGDSSQTDVGLAETETSPAGKTAGVVIAVR